MAGDTDQAGRYDAVIQAIRDGKIPMIPGVPQIAAPKPLTFAEIEALIASYRPQPPPTRLRCHPSVLNALRDTAPEPDWLAPLPAPGVFVDVVVDHDMPFGDWELIRGDDVVSRSGYAAFAAAVGRAWTALVDQYRPAIDAVAKLAHDFDKSQHPQRHSRQCQTCREDSA